MFTNEIMYVNFRLFQLKLDNLDLIVFAITISIMNVAESCCPIG
jgi:hypothetical protein